MICEEPNSWTIFHIHVKIKKHSFPDIDHKIFMALTLNMRGPN